jgi:hypothetical protein
MKDKINKAIEYLKQISLKEPKNIRVEELFDDRLTLSYEEDTGYTWNTDRIYKTFTFKVLQIEDKDIYEIDAMITFNN